MKGLVKSSANFVPLTPLTFLDRSAIVYRDNTSIIYGDIRHSWSQTRERCLKLASALSDRFSITYGDVVAVIAPNVPAMYELHFAVPMAGAILCTLNIRYDANTISSLLAHSEAKAFFVDFEFLQIADEALDLLSKRNLPLPETILINEIHGIPSPAPIDYETILKSGNPNFPIRFPKDENDPISLNYTSGTTSTPKGVIYTHRGAFLNSLSSLLLNEMPSLPVYLWSVPMFHCNGWCMTWTIAAQGGANVCLRKVTPEAIFHLINLHKVSYMAGAPTILNMLVNSRPEHRRPLPGKVTMVTGGAPPAAHVLLKMKSLGFEVIHSYGLTETYGAATVCTWKPEWDRLSDEAQSKLKSRQGVHHHCLSEVDVKNPSTGESVPADGRTMGEVSVRGNTVMGGYLKDPEGTAEAFRGGYLRTGDLGVKHCDGYVEIRDRSKDIVICGGENVSTIGVEGVLYGHPAVEEVAVVAQPDERWGEIPCAFVKVREGRRVAAEEIVAYCRARLPHFMAPKNVVFDELPKTATGKVQKFVLRERARAFASKL